MGQLLLFGTVQEVLLGESSLAIHFCPLMGQPQCASGSHTQSAAPMCATVPVRQPATLHLDMCSALQQVVESIQG